MHSIELRPPCVLLLLLLLLLILTRPRFCAPCNDDCTAYRSSAAHMLDDVLRHEGTGSAHFLLSVRCWPAPHRTRVYRRLSEHPIAFLSDAGNRSAFVLPAFGAAHSYERHSSNRMFVVADLRCGWRENWLAQVNATYLKHPIRWMLLAANGVAASEFRGDVRRLAVHTLLDSEITVAIWNATTLAFRLEQIYKLHSDVSASTNDTAIVEPFGIWQRDGQPRFIDLRDTTIVSRRRRNLQSHSIRATYALADQDSLHHLTDFKYSQVDTPTKTGYIAVSTMLDALNATHRPRFVDSWGFRDGRTGRYTGILGELVDGHTDIGGSTFFPVVERVPLIEFASVVNPTPMGFVFRAPPLSYVQNIYALPFGGDVWLAASAMVVLSCAAIGLTLRQHGHGNRTEAADAAAAADAPVSGSDLVLLGVSGVAQMGGTLPAERLSTRLSLITFLIFLLFMFTSYAANIVSLLQATTRSIRTLDDLYRSNLEFGVVNTSYAYYWFGNTFGRVQRAIYAEKVTPPGEPEHFVNMSYGLQRLQQGMYALHSETGPLFLGMEQTFYAHEKCGLGIVDYLGMPPPWVALRKRSPYKEVVKINLLKIREHGIQSRILDRMYTKKPACTDGGQSFQPVRFVDCRILVQLLAIGCVLAAGVFGLEVLWPHRSRLARLLVDGNWVKSICTRMIRR